MPRKTRVIRERTKAAIRKSRVTRWLTTIPRREETQEKAGIMRIRTGRKNEGAEQWEGQKQRHGEGGRLQNKTWDQENANVKLYR